jgi:LacI family transcriptional regulator
MARGMTDEALRFGYNAIISNTDQMHSQELSAIQSMAEYNVSGLIQAGVTNIKPKSQDIFKALSCAFITVENYTKGTEYCVYVDNYTGSYKAVTHLFSRVHKQTAYITGFGSLHAPENERLRVLSLPWWSDIR